MFFLNSSNTTKLTLNGITVMLKADKVCEFSQQNQTHNALSNLSDQGKTREIIIMYFTA